jgi:hypothetical protein
MSRPSGTCLVALLASAWLTAGAAPTSAREQRDDRAQVAGVARDYFEGWYTADPERMGRALHPDMVKRYVEALPSGRQVVQSASRDLMVEMTRAGGGSKTPPDRRNISVDVLEVSGDIAIARVSSSEYLEYLSLARCNGEWAIINVLWRFQTPSNATRSKE